MGLSIVDILLVKDIKLVLEENNRLLTEQNKLLKNIGEKGERVI